MKNLSFDRHDQRNCYSLSYVKLRSRILDEAY